jgi:RNA polymerase sigma-70 factor (ECF subfamily)
LQEPDPETIRAAAGGDIVAFEALVRAYQMPVLRFLRRYLGDPGLAEDAAQETFVRAYRRLSSFRYRSKFSTWLFQVARNAGVDAQRTHRRQDRVVTALRPPAAPSDPATTAELKAALASLTPKLREALLVVEVLGLTYREAADVLATAEGTVKSRVFQARERLSVWLEQEQADEM